MNSKIIKTEAEYQTALSRLSELMQAQPGTSEGDELELLAFMIENYEKEHFPIPLPDPIEAIKFCMEQQGLTRKDLVQYIGSQSKVSEVLNRKRPLSISMIRALEKGLGIPAEVLIQEPGEGPAADTNREDDPDSLDNQGETFSGSEEKVRIALQTIADFIGENSSLYQTHRYTRVTEEAGLFTYTDKSGSPEEKVESKPVKGFEKALERICMMEDLDSSGGQDQELAVATWLREELNHCFDLIHTGDSAHAAQRLFFLEEQTRKPGKNSPLFGVISDMVAQMRQMVELGDRKTRNRAEKPVLALIPDRLLAQADYGSRAKKEESSESIVFDTVFVRKTRGKNG